MRRSLKHRQMEIKTDIIIQVAKIEKETFNDSWSIESIEDTLKWDYNRLLVALTMDKESSDDAKSLDLMKDGMMYVHFAGGEGSILQGLSFLENEWIELPADIFNDVSVNVAGYVLYNLVAGESEIYRIAVKFSKRGLGYGRKLLQQYLRCIEKNVKKSFLEVRAGNERACNLYEQNGYIKIAERKKYYSNPNEDAYIYEVELP